jgi:ABC-2 type transport system ATP-binding protein
LSDAIEAQGLVREYKGGVRAVNEVSLRVGTGEIYGFLGPNGAGKSTTVRMLATLLRPTAGTARVAGFDVVADAPKVRTKIGIALQDAAIDPWMTGRELLHLQAALHNFSRADGRARAQSLLEQVDIVDAADRRVGTYSGGMRRRLDLALSLVHEPSILFLDEPTTGLDPLSRQTVWDEVKRLNVQNGATIFLTTQYLEEADQLAGRVGIIDGGRIVAEGTPEALKAQIGASTLAIELEDAGRVADARGVMGRFGTLGDGTGVSQSVILTKGAETVAEVVRELDAAGVKVAGLELHKPTLDDVFLAKTGRAMGGDDAADATS